MVEQDGLGLGRPASSASLASLGLAPGSTLFVLVEMSDDPVEQWWPATVQGLG